MKLSSVQVTEYKSIRDSNRFDVGGVTCLVGKNESGKTAILEALYRLNPLVPEHGNFSVTDDYPRAYREDYQQDLEAKRREPATVITAVFDLEPAELESLAKELGSNCLTANKIELSKGYENKLYYKIEVNEPQLVKTLVSTANLPKDVAKAAADKTSLSELNEYLNADIENKRQGVAEATAKANLIEDEPKKAAALDKAKQLVAPPELEALRGRIAKLTEPSIETYIWTNFLKKSLPKFLYFDEYYLMDGKLNIEALKNRQASNTLLDSDRPMLGLIDLARMKLDDLLNATRTEALVNSLEGASNHLSRQVLKFWSQNRHLSVRFDVRPAKPNDPPGMTEGTNLWGRVGAGCSIRSIKLQHPWEAAQKDLSGFSLS